MKRIPLRNGGVTVVDDEQYGHLVRFKWYMDGNGYAVRHIQGRGTREHGGVVYMHRWIMGMPQRLCVDHINRDKLDNRVENLRICFQKNNARNRGPWAIKKNGRFKGVHKDGRRKTNPWRSHITVDRKYIHLGQFETEVEAALAYNKVATKYHGEFALLNEV